jgi:RNA polymerase sigma factor (sigma-70 family)
MSALDHSSLSALYSEHNGWLKAWLRARLGNSTDAADLAQDTFVRVLTSRNAQPIRQPRTYLSAIARALMIDKFRRKAIEQAYLAVLALRPEPVDISPETRLSILETLTAIDAMLDGLGERTRRIFLTVQLEGLSYVAASQQLQVSVTTIKNHMVRAITHCLLLMDD